MMMINLYQTPPNISSIGVGCDSLGKTFLLLLVDNLGATGGLRLNSSPVKVKLIIFPLFLPEGNAILPITPKAVCLTETIFLSLVFGFFLVLDFLHYTVNKAKAISAKLQV